MTGPLSRVIPHVLAAVPDPGSAARAQNLSRGFLLILLITLLLVGVVTALVALSLARRRRRLAEMQADTARRRQQAAAELGTTGITPATGKLDAWTESARRAPTPSAAELDPPAES